MRKLHVQVFQIHTHPAILFRLAHTANHLFTANRRHRLRIFIQRRRAHGHLTHGRWILPRSIAPIRTQAMQNTIFIKIAEISKRTLISRC